MSKLNRADFDIHRGTGGEDTKLFVLANGPDRDMIINGFYAAGGGSNFGSGKIEYFVFKDGVLSAEQLGIQ